MCKYEQINFAFFLKFSKLVLYEKVSIFLKRNRIVCECLNKMV